jgi:hypothetical protein
MSFLTGGSIPSVGPFFGLNTVDVEGSHFLQDGYVVEFRPNV